MTCITSTTNQQPTKPDVLKQVDTLLAKHKKHMQDFSDLMQICVFNQMTTPDGTVLRCMYRHDYKAHVDAVTGEQYMNDGCFTEYTRQSINKVQAKVDQVWFDPNNPTHDFVEVRKYVYVRDEDNNQVQLAQADDDLLLCKLEHTKDGLFAVLVAQELKYRYSV